MGVGSYQNFEVTSNGEKNSVEMVPCPFEGNIEILLQEHPVQLDTNATEI